MAGGRSDDGKVRSCRLGFHGLQLRGSGRDEGIQVGTDAWSQRFSMHPSPGWYLNQIEDL